MIYFVKGNKDLFSRVEERVYQNSSFTICTDLFRDNIYVPRAGWGETES